MLDAFKDLGFHYATQAGVTISKNDVLVPPSKQEILGRYEKEVREIQDQYEDGLITQEERHLAVTDKWNEATEEVAEAMIENIEGADQLNSIYMMANSGARGSFKQIRQLAGMRGLMANPKGEIIERPVKANFMEGLDVIEYFTSTHGARKGLADTALRTADSGYLTRRLVDVAQDVIIRIEDCGTEEYLDAPLYKETGDPNEMLIGRVTAKDVTTKRGQGPAGGRPGDHAREPGGARRGRRRRPRVTVPVRSVLKCEATTGVCQACYGRSLATGQMAMIGDAVGIIAAQSIGEPGTQLTMRTFHTGGVAGADITHGLPRVVELFEARKPKGLAKIAEVGGVVTIEDTDKSRTVVITDDAGEEHRNTFPRRTRLHVAEGEKIEPGTQLNEGSLYPHELLALRGRTATEVYLVKEVQEVYKSQGVDINDKHIELIGRQMLKKVRIDQKGDTDLLPGQFVDRHELRRINDAVRPRRRRAGPVRGDHPRHHQGLAGDGLVPVGGLLPGDHEGAHRRGARGQDRPPRRPEGERDHRQADPGRHRAQALPDDRDRADRAAPPRHRRRRAAGGRRPRRRARARGRRGPARASARRSTPPSWTRSTPASARPAARSTTSASSTSIVEVGRQEVGLTAPLLWRRGRCAQRSNRARGRRSAPRPARFRRAASAPAARPPTPAVLVVVIVDPGQRPVAAGVRVDRGELPVRVARRVVEPGAPSRREAQQVRQVLLRALLPARAPDALERARQPLQARSRSF